MSSHPILIVGAHRSGTSWVARALSEAGVFLGDELVGAELGNPYGHFEDVEVVSLHDSVLAEQQLTWKSIDPLARPLGDAMRTGIDAALHSRRRIEGPWAIKDPRLCLFLPEWLHVVPDARIIVVFRRPDEVVRSLHRRHARRWVDSRRIDPSDISFWEVPDLALHLWVHYNEQLLGSLEATDPANMFVLDWNDPQQASQLVDEVTSRWRLDLTDADTARDPSLGQPVDAPVEVRDGDLLERAHGVWERLHEMKRSMLAHR